MQDPLPEYVYMTGLPFFLQGWNRKLKRITMSGGQVAYRLEPYTLYGFLSIIGITLMQDGAGRWSIYRDCDLPYSMGISRVGTSMSPIGEWTQGRVVASPPAWKRPFY